MTSFGDVDTVQELSDILVSDSADLLDICTTLGDVFDGVTRDNQFILLDLGEFSSDTFWDSNLSDLLVTQEVSDFNELGTVFFNDVDVNWEMRIDKSHLVLVTNGNTLDQVGDQRLDGSQSSNVLSVTVVDVDLDQLLVDLFESNIDVLQGLGQFTSWTSNLNDSGLDVDSDVFWNVDGFDGLDVLHCLFFLFVLGYKRGK